MISRLRGRAVARTGEGMVLDVNGVGYLIAATPAALRAAEGGGETTIETYLHVREDTLQLYGFADTEERDLFTLLLTVNGIGPKVALGVVSGSPPEELRRAIALGDHARFQMIPGIGKKTAERIVLELKERISVSAAITAETLEAHDGGLDARAALVELGWSILEAEQALSSIDPELTTEERVRLALRSAA